VDRRGTGATATEIARCSQTAARRRRHQRAVALRPTDLAPSTRSTNS
jgi:hypothetical protein